MVCEKVLGKLSTFNVNGKTVDYVDIDWDDAFKKIHRKITAQGRDIGIRMDDSVLTHGLTEGDVLYADDQLIIAVRSRSPESDREGLLRNRKPSRSAIRRRERPDLSHALQRANAAYAQPHSRSQPTESCPDT